MKTILTAVFTSIFGLTCFCQTTIEGVITDGSTPVSGANIFIVDSYDGGTSDAQGRFSFICQEVGEKTLVVRFVGYREYSHKVVLGGEKVIINVKLDEEINELDAVTISAGAFTASDETRRTVFRAVDIATTAGATADIAGALNTLPGTQKVGESGRLFVRGGDGTEARTFIDGMVVLDAYSPSAPNTPSRGRFLPFMFKGTSFSTGGYSAEFGQALSSALALDSKDESEVTRTDIGVLSVGGDVAHTQAWSAGSVAAKIQYTNIRPYFGLINQEIDWKTAPASIEAVTAFRQKTGKNGMMKFYGNFSDTELSLYQHDIDDYNQKSLYDLRNRYSYMNASYKSALDENWSFRSGISYSLVRNKSEVNSSEISEEEQGLHLKTVLEGALSEAVTLKAGAEMLQRNYRQHFYGNGFTFDFAEYLPSLFAEVDLYASNHFVARVGGRYEFNSLTNKSSVDPRVSLAYQFAHGGQVSFAYGRFRQTARNEYVKLDNELDNEKAEHFILNYQHIRNNRTFRLEGFYKRYEDLIRYSNLDALSNDGHGFAKGIEVFWRDNESLEGVDYWVSYSLLHTKRNYLNYPAEAIPSFASRHNFSLVGKYFIKSLKSQVGATYSFASGRPYNNPNHEKFNGSRTPAYQDLSVNWSYLPKPHLILYLSCTNIPGFDNVFGYEFSETPNTSGLYNGRAIRPAATRFIFLGIFITLSKSKSFNQLPSL